MQRIFRRLHEDAKRLANESNAEVEVVVKYTFTEKPQTLSASPDENIGQACTAREVSYGRNSPKPSKEELLVESSAPYVQIWNPGTRPPPRSKEGKSNSREVKSQKRTSVTSSRQETLQVRI
ncbi:unnamed protein product [Thelazia callipaeda]|uniref:Uncharacterized protein n=1 Tax=Thelazia callipaeda TaxID=103827 RepID=A0A0N5CY27_THECL|nr:unnamed protein product [Thelazia callipaeda]